MPETARHDPPRSSSGPDPTSNAASPDRTEAGATPRTEAGRYMLAALAECDWITLPEPTPKYGLNFTQRILAIEAEASSTGAAASEPPVPPEGDRVAGESAAWIVDCPCEGSCHHTDRRCSDSCGDRHPVPPEGDRAAGEPPNLYDPVNHVEDGHGGCVICRFYVPHTDDEYVVVQWPCWFAAPQPDAGLHRLLMPPHPGGVYRQSALCSCGEWQWDGDSDILDYQRVLYDHTQHRLSSPDAAAGGLTRTVLAKAIHDTECGYASHIGLDDEDPNPCGHKADRILARLTTGDDGG
jgi:hypothetical protein